MLKVQGLTKFFGADELLRDVEFRINEADKVGLVGANGTGKTTLLKIILGQEEYDAGSVQLDAASVGYAEQQAKITAKSLYEELKTAFDDILTLGERKKKMEELIAQGNAAPDMMEKYGRLVNEFERVEGYDYESRLRRVAFGLGFTEADFALDPTHFSGGEKTRLCLAKALLREPEFLFLDEPTNHLDIQMVEWLEEFLRDYKGALLVVSHDRLFLDNVTNRTLELDNHTLTSYAGNYSRYAAQKQERRLALTAAYNKQQDYIRKTEEYIRRYKAGIKAKQARGRQSRLNRLERIVLPPEAANFAYFSFHPPAECAERVMETENLSVGFGAGTPLFAAVNVTVRRGDGIALIGANGAGKTTLLKLIAGEMTPAAGSVKIGSRVQIGYFSQQHENLHSERSVLEEILYDDYGVDEPQARNYLGAFLFKGDEVYRKVGELSGGEKARLAFLKLMLTGANFLLLDEPTNHLDIPAKEAVEEALMTFPGTFIAVSHDRYFLTKVAGNIWELDNGRLTVFNGDYAYYREQKQRIAASDNKINVPTPRQALKAEQAKITNEATNKTNGVTGTKTGDAKKAKTKKSEKTEKYAFIAGLSGEKREALLNRTEAEIAMLEAELKALEKVMNLPQTQADASTSGAIAADYAAKEKEIAAKYELWGELCS